MITTITQLSKTLDSASYIDTFVWFFLLMPLIVAVPIVIYAVLLSAVSFIRSFL